jgi:hypothetical protein
MTVLQRLATASLFLFRMFTTELFITENSHD